jgi:hypothetical protein
MPTLQEAAGKENVILTEAVTRLIFLSTKQKYRVYIISLGMPKVKNDDMPSHHTPDFTLTKEFCAWNDLYGTSYIRLWI